MKALLGRLYPHSKGFLRKEVGVGMECVDRGLRTGRGWVHPWPVRTEARPGRTEFRSLHPQSLLIPPFPK